MKAVVYAHYGPPEVLEIKDVARPAPKDNEVLIRVHATTVTKYDTWMRSATAPPGFGLISRIASGINGPKQPILGTDVAGEIEAVGQAVTRFKVGDQVYGFSAALGTHAEYICLPEAAVVEKPATATYEEAAAVVQGALTALYFLKQANIQPGQNVLIFGASGGIGVYAVQLARHFGADVTGVCSTRKLEMVKALGASHVIDYTEEDFTRNGQLYDVVFDTVGKTSVSGSKRALKKNGVYLLATFGVPKLVPMLWLSLTSRVKIVAGTLTDVTDDLIFLSELIEAGQLRAVIDRCYPLEQTAEAHRHVESGRKAGIVVVTM